MSDSYALDTLDQLEAESIHILREVVAESELRLAQTLRALLELMAV